MLETTVEYRGYSNNSNTCPRCSGFIFASYEEPGCLLCGSVDYFSPPLRSIARSTSQALVVAELDAKPFRDGQDNLPVGHGRVDRMGDGLPGKKFPHHRAAVISLISLWLGSAHHRQPEPALQSSVSMASMRSPRWRWSIAEFWELTPVPPPSGYHVACLSPGQ